MQGRRVPHEGLQVVQIASVQEEHDSTANGPHHACLRKFVCKLVLPGAISEPGVSNVAVPQHGSRRDLSHHQQAKTVSLLRRARLTELNPGDIVVITSKQIVLGEGFRVHTKMQNVSHAQQHPRINVPRQRMLLRSLKRCRPWRCTVCRCRFMRI